MWLIWIEKKKIKSVVADILFLDGVIYFFVIVFFFFVIHYVYLQRIFGAKKIDLTFWIIGSTPGREKNKLFSGDKNTASKSEPTCLQINFFCVRWNTIQCLMIYGLKLTGNTMSKNSRQQKSPTFTIFYDRSLWIWSLWTKFVGTKHVISFEEMQLYLGIDWHSHRWIWK